jgi:Mn2+/Fe2+ NRAMP family transporter
MGFSNAVALFIILTTAATLHAHGVTDIQTSSQAAEALRPIAGKLAFMIFAVGIIGTGFLAIPVLAGSAAYALGETFGWHVGLSRKLSRAKAFYAAIAVATLLGVLLNNSPIDPIKALFWSAVINGVVAVPVMALMMHLSSNRTAMGRFKLGRDRRHGPGRGGSLRDLGEVGRGQAAGSGPARSRRPLHSAGARPSCRTSG